MKKLYHMTRLVGYVCGVGGVILILLGRAGHLPPPFMAAGAVAIVITLVAFAASYLIFALMRVRRPPPDA